MSSIVVATFSLRMMRSPPPPAQKSQHSRHHEWAVCRTKGRDSRDALEARPRPGIRQVDRSQEHHDDVETRADKHTEFGVPPNGQRPARSVGVVELDEAVPGLREVSPRQENIKLAQRDLPT